MLPKLLLQFEQNLRQNQPEVLESLLPGKSRSYLFHKGQAQWFVWRDGQPESAPQFMKLYNFISFNQGKKQLQQAICITLVSPFCLALAVTFAPQLLYAQAILTDGAGDGFFYSYLTGCVLYCVEGEMPRSFRSMTSFVQFLVEVAEMGKTASIEGELELLYQYTK